jgi:hypothetical protein
VEEVNGDILGNRNRKGYFAMVALGAVDVFARFRFAELNWSGSTPDSVVFSTSSLGEALKDEMIPSDLHIIGDEAYSNSHPQLLTPYSKRSLRTYKNRDPEEYGMRRTFNALLSYQRSTIERAFGMLVRKFIILDQTFNCKRRHLKKLFRVCCSLHNLCVDEWIVCHQPDVDYRCHLLENPSLHDEYIRELFNDHNETQWDPLPSQPLPNQLNSQGPRRHKIAHRIYHEFLYRFEAG